MNRSFQSKLSFEENEIKRKRQVMGMREEEQLLPAVRRVGLALCPFAVEHKHDLKCCFSSDIINADIQSVCVV